MAVNASSSSAASNAVSSSAVRALALELKSLQEDPLEGIRSRLVNEDNLFEWEVALFGPPDTLYQGGYFKVSKNFRVCILTILTSNLFLCLLSHSKLRLIGIWRIIKVGKNGDLTRKLQTNPWKYEEIFWQKMSQFDNWLLIWRKNAIKSGYF